MKYKVGDKVDLIAPEPKKVPLFKIGDRVTYTDTSVGYGVGTVKWVGNYPKETDFRYDVRFDKRNAYLISKKHPDTYDGRWLRGAKEELLILAENEWMSLEEFAKKACEFFYDEDQLVECIDQRGQVRRCLRSKSGMCGPSPVLCSLTQDGKLPVWLLHLDKNYADQSCGEVPFMWAVRYARAWAQ